MPFLAHCRQAATSVPGISALVAVLLRLAVLGGGWAQNPQLPRPQMDGFVYLTWAHDIAAGDLLGRAGFAGGEPFFFNPLYAYLLAPFLSGLDLPAGAEHLTRPLDPVLGVLAPRILAVLVFQALLAGATAALAAAAADRFFGRTAAWVAGIGVACSTVLVHMDQHVAVSGLAAFLTAGAVYACSPNGPGDSPSRHWALGARGPFAAGIWLGLGALARPIPLLALPFVAWLFKGRTGKGWKGAAVVVLAFAACAVPSLARNWTVSGKPYVWTAAGGINAYLGNNPAARATRSMNSPPGFFAFEPLTMHRDARHLIGLRRAGPPPDWDEVSSYFWKETRAEFVRAPGASLAHYANKARWFLAPAEVPSSASLAVDLQFQPLLHLAFVPTWLLGVLGLLGLGLHVRRRAVLLGPGALVGAHLAVLTLVFPLSHYRSPAVPVLAVLAGGAVAWGVAAVRARRRKALAGAAGAVLVLVLAAWAPPGPDPLAPSDALRLASTYRDMADQRFREGDSAGEAHYLERAARRLQAAKDAQRRWHPDLPELPQADFFLAQILWRQARLDQAAEVYAAALALEPANPEQRLNYSCLLQKLGRLQQAAVQAESVYRDPDVR